MGSARLPSIGISVLGIAALALAVLHSHLSPLVIAISLTLAGPALASLLLIAACCLTAPRPASLTIERSIEAEGADAR